MLCNRDRAREVMAAADVTAIVATTYDGVLYLSDFDNGLPFFTGTKAAAILPADVDAAPTLIVAMPYLAHLVKAPTWMPDVRCFGSIGYATSPQGVTASPESDVLEMFEDIGARSYPNLSAAVVAALDDIAGPAGTVAFDDPSFAAGMPDQWNGDRVRDAAGLLAEIRLIKTPDEIERLRSAAAVNESAFDAAAGVIRDGGRWADATGAWRRRWTDAGGVPMFWGGGAGAHASQFYPMDTDYRISAGDVIRFEGGGVLGGYWADTGGSAIVGDLDSRTRRFADALAAGAATAKELIRPNATAEEVCSSVLDTIRSSGIPDFPDPNAWGHGIGLELNERPRFRPGSPDVLQEGMVLCFETPYFELGWGGLQAEDTFVVTSDGNELLTHAPRDAWVIGGSRNGE